VIVIRARGSSLSFFVLKRLLNALVTVFVVITVVFLLMRLLPMEGYFGDDFDRLTEVQKEAVLERMGLLDPWHVQLQNFYRDLARGYLGTSIIYLPNVPVWEILAPRIPYSLKFGLASLLLSLTFGLILGIFQARERGKWFDHLGTSYVVFINAVPAAVYFLFIQLYLTQLSGLPILYSSARPISWILPAISMSLGGIAGYAMWIRRFMVDELNKDYIKLARAKGLPNTQVMFSHVLRNSFVPMVQHLPTTLLMTIAGSIFIESLYSIPGMGGLLVDAISRQDNPLVQSLVLIYASIGVFGLFLGDILMALTDPRIRLEKAGGAR